jgi:hypothetical protein
MSDILNCPFCGGESELHQTGKYELTLKCVGVQPSGLRGCGPKLVQKVLPNRHTLEWLGGKMTETWNRRASLPTKADDTDTRGSEPTVKAWTPVPYDHEITLQSVKAADSNTDGADPRAVLLAVLGCTETWVGDARIIGNVRAVDIAVALRAALSLNTETAP